jgi:hypothetical protein
MGYLYTQVAYEDSDIIMKYVCYMNLTTQQTLSYIGESTLLCPHPKNYACTKLI